MSHSVSDTEYDIKKYHDECIRIIEESEERSRNISKEIDKFAEKARKIVHELTEREKALSDVTAELVKCQRKLDECIDKLKDLSNKYSSTTMAAGGGWGAVIGGVVGTFLGGPPGAFAGAMLGGALGFGGTTAVDISTAGEKRKQLNDTEKFLNTIKIDLNVTLATCRKELQHLKQILSEKELLRRLESPSDHYNFAKEEMKVPFVHHQVLECDYRGIEYYSAEHNICLRIP